jgi:hypothetical protein
VFLGDAELAAQARGGWDEAFWMFGAAAVPRPARRPLVTRTDAFPLGGAYVLRADDAHVFIDCGPVGLAGRGGHGHNDALSFEAALGGLAVVSDAGCFVYTASFEERNHFRATAAHNTPQIDGEEINRFVSPDLLWLLQDDARPLEPRVLLQGEHLVFEGGHSGYRRLHDPVVPWRRIQLHRDGASLRITDTFRGSGRHCVSVPLQLAPGWMLLELRAQRACCASASGERIRISWGGKGEWRISEEPGRVAPSYGVVVPAVRFACRAMGPIADLSLDTTIERIQENVSDDSVGR